MKKLLMAIALTSVSSAVISAGFIDNAKVTDVRVDENGKGIITFDKPRSREPAECGNTYNSSLSFDATTEGGKAIMSMALTALSTGKEVAAWGRGDCLQYPNYVESWTYGHIYK